MDNGAEHHGVELRVAAFLTQALDLEDDPAELVGELTTLKRDHNAGISTIELHSSVGPVAFLIYHYILDAQNEDAKTGRALFDADLKTLEQAAERDAPGPRLLAHATTEDEAYILATTPSTFRALTGESPTAPVDATTDNTTETRRDTALELLRLLRDADTQAAAWLAAVNAEGHLTPGSPNAGQIAFNEEETALALFLLDERSIQNVLSVLNLLITIARNQTTDAIGGETESRVVSRD